MVSPLMLNLSDRETALLTSYVVIALQRDNTSAEYHLPESKDQLMRLGRQLNGIQREIVAKLEAQPCC